MSIDAHVKYNESVRILMERYFKRHNDIPNRLYHYTSAGGLHGIASNKTIFLTNARFLNDPGELIYAANLVRASVAIARDQRGSVLDDFLKHIENILDPDKLTLEAYVSCFCEDGDLLSQWRSYGGNADGYAIGFDFSGINWSTHADKAPPPELRKVLYCHKEQATFISEWTNAIADLIEETGDEISDNQLQQFRKTVAECMITFKSPAYQEEQEWRLISVQQHPKDLKFLAQARFLKPYVEFKPNGGLPIRSVKVGPVLNFDLTKRSVTMMLDYYEYDKIDEMKPSSILYRPS